MNDKIPPFIIFPRYIADDYKSGKLNLNEWMVYSWLRMQMDPYGAVTVSMSAIREDILPKLKVNSVNKTLLSLLHQEYLYFETRQGKRGGSFKVYFGDLILPGGNIKRNADLFVDDKPPEDNLVLLPEKKPPAHQKSDTTNQMLDDAINVLSHGFSAGSNGPHVRSHYNDTKNDNEIDIDRGSVSNKGKERTPVRGYVPRTWEEIVCRDLAVEVGETDMNFLLSILRAHGIDILKKATEIYRNSGEYIEKPPAYLNTIIRNLIIEKNDSS